MLALVLVLLVAGMGAALAVGLIAGWLGVLKPNCGTFIVDRTGTCGTNSALATQVAPVIPTLDPARFRLEPMTR